MIHLIAQTTQPSGDLANTLTALAAVITALTALIGAAVGWWSNRGKIKMVAGATSQLTEANKNNPNTPNVTPDVEQAVKDIAGKQ